MTKISQLQGWSTTWDRYVSVEFLLKDAPSNRVLQQTVRYVQCAHLFLRFFFKSIFMLP